MSGFDNEVLYATGERLQSSNAQAITLMQDTVNNPGFTNVSRINHVGDPNGVVSANPSSLCHDPVSGFFWLKVSGTGTTVWQRLAAGDITSVLTANATPQFALVGTVETVDFNLTNLVLGSSLPSALGGALGNVGMGSGDFGNAPLNNLTNGQGNTSIGYNSGRAISGGSNNVLLGQGAGSTVVSGVENVAIGSSAFFTGTGDDNIALGQNSLSFLTTGSQNISIGVSSSSTYNGSESSNIIIGNVGVNGESNTLRIGTTGSGSRQQNKAFMAAITGVTVAASAPVGVDTNGQLSSLGIGTAGQVFTSGGAGVSAAFQNISLTGNSGGALSPTSGNWNIVTSNASIAVAGTGSTLTLNFNQTNLVLGSSLPSLTSAGRNVGLGSNCLNALTSGSDCTVVGYQAGQALTSAPEATLVGASAGAALTISPNVTAIGSDALLAATGAPDCTAVGYQSLRSFTTVGSARNTALGSLSAGNLLTGVRNIAIGYLAASTYTGAESSNIIIGSSATTGDNNTVRIGNQGTGVGQQNLCFISGITGATVTGTAVLCSTAGQLGTIASSERYKENIADMSESVSVMHLRPIEFNYKVDPGKTKQYGLLAEDMHKDFPYLCFYNEAQQPESVKYHELCTLLLHEVQKLNKRIEVLEKVDYAAS